MLTPSTSRSASPTYRARPALLLALLALAACDQSTPDPDPGPLTFAGVEVEPRGDASLAVQNGALVVSGLSGTRSGGFAVNGTPVRFDAETDAVTIPAGGRFGIVVEDAAGQPLAELFNEADAGGASDLATLRFAFPEGVLAARVTYQLADTVVFSIPALELVAENGRAAQRAQPTGRRSQQGSAGQAQGKAGSVHAIRRSDGTYTVVSDSENSAKRAGSTPGLCPGFTIRPPVALPRNQFPEGTLCADWVQIDPIGGPAPPAAARAAVMAQGVGSFTVRSLTVAY